MDKTKFLFRLQEMFSGLKGRSLESLKEEFNVVLNDYLDYDRLYKIFCAEWETTTRPLPKDLKPFVARAKKQAAEEMSDDVKTDLKTVARWFNSPDWQHKRKPIPDHIRLIINHRHFSAEMIDRMIISEELYA